MSTAKYSGIAVAAANRAALARQEAEAERLKAPKPVAEKEEALLRHLRATMTASSLLGVDAREKTASTTASTAPRRVVEAAAVVVASEPSSSGRTALQAQRTTERARIETNVVAPRVVEKRHMSKAERKRLKRARSESRADADARPARAVGDVGVGVSIKKSTKKTKKKHLGPVGRA